MHTKFLGRTTCETTGRQQVIDPRLSGNPTSSLVQAFRLVPEFSHISKHQNPSSWTRSKHLNSRFERCRIRVVGVVYQLCACLCLFLFKSMPNRSNFFHTITDLFRAAANRPCCGHRRQRVACIVSTEQAQLKLHPVIGKTDFHQEFVTHCSGVPPYISFTLQSKSDTPEMTGTG